jgi:hypothetical protein
MTTFPKALPFYLKIKKLIFNKVGTFGSVPIAFNSC